MWTLTLLLLCFIHVESYRYIIKSHNVRINNRILGKIGVPTTVHYSSEDDIFGAEFRLTKTAKQDKKEAFANGNNVMQGFRKLRSTVLADSLFFAAVGISAVWTFGTLKDVSSYSVGASLGICYAVLLGRYVERLGTARESKASDSLRFVPVVMLVLLYSKFKTEFSLIMELAGFAVTYQAASFLQGFNANAYGDDNGSVPKQDIE